MTKITLKAMGERMVSWIIVIGSNECPYKKNWSLPHTIPKNQFQIDGRFQYESKNNTLSRKKKTGYVGDGKYF